MAQLLLSTSLIILYLLCWITGTMSKVAVDGDVSQIDQPVAELPYEDDGGGVAQSTVGYVEFDPGATKGTIGFVDAITDPVTDALTDAPTEPVTDPVTDALTDPPTQPVTDPVTDALTDPPTTVTDPVTSAEVITTTETDAPTTTTTVTDATTAEITTTPTDVPTTVTDATTAGSGAPPTTTTTVTDAVTTTVLETTTTTVLTTTTTVEIPKEMTEIIGQIYGPGLTEDEIRVKTEELVENPAQVQDYVPNIMGDMKEDARSNISWSAKDMFLYVAVDGERIDYEANFIQWNDRTLGNCFTLNHFDSNRMYNIGPIGIEVMMRLYESEYVPWMQTSAIIVYTHSNKETVFSESPGVVCRGGTHTWMQVKPVQFRRLGGRYGKCVKDLKDTKSPYYYRGSYTTGGCLRSCYQDVMKSNCGCMDSRYATPNGEKACSIALQTCIDNVTNTRNDLSQWAECNCPQPCNNDIYDTQWSATKLMQQDLNCDNSTSNCSISDIAIMRLVLLAVTSQVFIEEPAVDFARFLSSMGGIMGLFFGFSMIACFEVIFMCSTLCYIAKTGKYRKIPDKDDKMNIFNGRKRNSNY